MNNMMGMLMQMMGGGKMNPMQMMSQMQNNPMMGRAQEMANGKSPQQLEQLCQNMCQQKGMDFNQIKSMAQGMGFKL